MARHSRVNSSTTSGEPRCNPSLVASPRFDVQHPELVAEHVIGTLAGVVEVDGAYFGGHAKQEDIKADCKDRRLVE